TRWINTLENEQVKYGDELRPRSDFLNWQDMREIVDSGLVEVASHSHDMHRGILANSFGNLQPSGKAFAYDASTERYETETEFTRRLTDDLETSQRLFVEHLGKPATTMVWPYGAYNNLSNAAASELGMDEFLTLDSLVNHRDKPGIHRELVSNETELRELRLIAESRFPTRPVRAVHLDLDYLYDDDDVQFARNLDLLLDRIKAMQVSTVYLQAFADPDGNGVADALYFVNRHLPLRKDIFNRVAWQLRTRANVQVYAWMPVLAFRLPDPAMNQRLAVQSADGSHLERYHRLSPFSDEARTIIGEIYADLGRSSSFNGVLFHDDAFLTDQEDVHPAALAFAQAHGVRKLSSNHKTEQLLRLTDKLSEILRTWQPGLKTARNLYAEVVLNPHSENWFAQDFAAFLERYDHVALMAMPYLEEVDKPAAWLAHLRKTVRKHDPSLKRTVFHMQTLDWRSGMPVANKVLAEQFEQMLKGGVRHIAYYPDDIFNNHPDLSMVRAKLSVNDFPALLGVTP
ncbi:MAG: biofilm PGA synthesis lipoprotein PgaB, partial [Limisphaerales bacterium]